MDYMLSTRTRRRLDIQGLEAVADERLCSVTPWHRLAFGLCALLAAAGTATASPVILLVLLPIAVVGAAMPVHPFDLLYNLAIRRITGTGPLPRRGAPTRFACGLASAMLIAIIWAFTTHRPVLGYVLGSTMVAVATLVSTTDICIPSMIYRTLFGWPPRRSEA